jgi:hypothetical protein
VGSIEVTQPDSSLSQKVVIARHDANDWREEDREGRENCDEGSRAINQLPWLYDPSRHKGDDCSTTYI